MNRVMSKPRAGTHTGQTTVETELLARVTPLRLLCDSPSGVSLVIILPTAFDVMRGKGLDCVSLSELHDSRSVVHGHVLRPSSVAGGDEGSLYFKDTMRGQLIKSTGAAALPCSPSQSVGADGTAMWQFPIFSLLILHTLQWDEWKLGRSPLSTVKEPYHDSTSSAMFIIDGTESEGAAVPGGGAAPSGGTAAAATAARESKVSANEQTVACPVCTQPWQAKLMPHHMGAHLLEDNWAKYGKEKPRMPCMLCGINVAVGEYMNDPTATFGCPISLARGSNASIQKPRH
eukprot:4880052-Prymnesium_polylepis.1